MALHRERARLLRDVLQDLEAAHAALDEARRLMPEHPLLTTDMLDLADQKGSIELGQRTLESSAIPADQRLAAARVVDALGRAGRAAEALELARTHPTIGLVARIALTAETGDAIGLADAFEAEGEQGEGVAAAHAFVRAATLRDLVLHDARHAEALYRKALDRQPGYPPAIDALEEMLRVDGRYAELAEVLERELAALGQEDGHEEAQAPRRRYLLEALVGLHRDRLARPARALVFQRQRVALDPSDLDGWVLTRDLEVAVSVAPEEDQVEGQKGDGDRAGAAGADAAAGRRRAYHLSDAQGAAEGGGHDRDPAGRDRGRAGGRRGARERGGHAGHRRSVAGRAILSRRRR